MIPVRLYPRSEFDRVIAASSGSDDGLRLVADMCRFNALAAIKLAGSGHPGTSMSALDILTVLYFRIMNVREKGWSDPNRDVFFSSKGHDAPGLYSVLFALGALPWAKYTRLRRIDGLPGHPDVLIEGIEANTGSLGMGISKGKGIALAKRLLGRGGNVYVMTGDGELQEGQVWESLASAVHLGLDRLTIIVDHNKVQSDQLVSEINDIGRLEEKFAAFGWNVARCDGHDIPVVEEMIRRLSDDPRPGVLIADTIKGRGVSFMEHPQALAASGGVYPWHAGAPGNDAFVRAQSELSNCVIEGFASFLLSPPREEGLDREFPAASNQEFLSQAYGDELVNLGRTKESLVVLDADLTADCRLTSFKEQFPDRFVELGIAEQDMVSVAGGLALHGMLPVVNSFGAFLAARANEQIYANATERTKVIYVCHYAGLVPASAGHSHQSVRDISLFAALPGIRIIHPCNADETRMAIRYCVNDALSSCVLRLPIGPSPRPIRLPDGYAFHPGRGCVIRDGADVVLFAYGPVMLHQVLSAADTLAANGIGTRVVNMPWLNEPDVNWLEEIVGATQAIACVDDHAPVGGLASALLAAFSQSPLSGRRFLGMGVEGIPVCGTPDEALAAHGLDGTSLARRIGDWLQHHE